jgi:hypothetical protein
MKSSLKHLPEENQKQILEFVKIIKQVSPAMVILHGSFATGKQQHDFSMEGNALTEYNSDYDFLVIMKDGEEIRDNSLTERLNNRFHQSGPVDIIVHDIHQVNRSLERGHYFFRQVVEDGVLLYDSGEVKLSQPRELSVTELKEVSQEYYDYWFSLSQKHFEVAILYYEKAVKEDDRFNFSMYNLFLAAEGLYTTVALVFTGYKPKTHNLDKLKKYTKSISEEFDAVFPKNPKDRYDAELFDLLKRSYVGAKYKMDFYIPQKDLERLISKVKELQAIVEKICKQKIATLA